jgi:hypothetical protein
MGTWELDRLEKCVDYKEVSWERNRLQGETGIGNIRWINLIHISDG